MEVVEVSLETYAQIIHSPLTVFHSAGFNALNADKCDEVLYLLFRDKKYRLGLIGGIRDNIFFTPFSAPFGGFSFLGKEIRIHFIDRAINLLQNFLHVRKIAHIQITLPPFRYEPTFLSKISNALTRQNFVLKSTDLNHHFELAKIQENYLENIKHSARKHILKAKKHELTFIKAQTEAEKREAYRIIQYNRQVRGNPLHVSWDRLIETTTLVKADFFLLGIPGNYFAASINFQVSEEVVQVIYWGSLPEKNDNRPMNLLAWKVFEYYYNQGFKWIDLGQSSIASLPQEGISYFKESMLCDVTLKQTFQKAIIPI